MNSITFFVSPISFSTCAKLEAWDFNKVITIIIIIIIITIISIYKDSVMESETSLSNNANDDGKDSRKWRPTSVL